MASTEALPAVDLGLPGWRWMADTFPHPYTLAIAEHWVTRGHIDRHVFAIVRED